MSDKPSIFERAELSQKKAASVGQTGLSLSKIISRLGAGRNRKPRFLLVDNEESVVQDWRNALTTYPILRQHADFDIFLIPELGHQSRVKDVRLGSLENLFALIKEKLNKGTPYEGFFIDNNLGSGALGLNGMQLIDRLRDEISEIRFFPFALITVSLENSVARQTAADTDVVRYMPKFDDAALLPRMVLEFEEMYTQARQAAWVELNRQVALELEDGGTAVAAGELAKAFLEKHMSVRSLYFRDGARGELTAFVMNDHFEAGVTLNVSDAPQFYRGLLEQPAEGTKEKEKEKRRKKEPGLRFNDLTSTDVGPTWMPKMQGWRALLTRIGDPVNGEGGVYAIYGPPEHQPFRKFEENLLHHLAVQLSNRRSREREHKQLRERQGRLTKLLSLFARPKSSADVGRDLATFLYEEFGKRPGAKAAATVRHFERGTGDLVRIDRPVGDLELTQPLDKININNSISVYARVARSMEPVLYPNVDDHRHEFLFTNPNVKSSLTLPLSFDGTCFGAANLESDRANAFTLADQELAGGVVGAAAAAIARHRSLRFLEEAAELLDAISESPRGADARTLLGLSANLLYRFCGYSDLIIALPPAVEGTPWDVVEAYRGDPRYDVISSADDELLQKWRDSIRSNWTSTHLSHMLSQSDEFAFTNKPGEYDIDAALRPGRPTLSQATLKVRAPGASEPEAMLALLFEHENPLSQRQKERLNAFARFMGRIFLAQGRTNTLSSQMSILSQEARLGRVHLTYQHHFKSGLTFMANVIDLAKRGVFGPESALDRIASRIEKLEPLSDRSRNLLKKVSLESVDAGELWDNLRDLMAGDADQAQITISPASSDLQCVHADPELLRTILFTLIDNTLRYAGAGTRITISQTDEGLLTVADNGVGLNPSIRAKLFEPDNTTNKFSTGVGLYLARLWAREMGGDMVYLSTNQGTAYEILLKRNH